MHETTDNATREEQADGARGGEQSSEQVLGLQRLTLGGLAVVEEGLRDRCAGDVPISNELGRKRRLGWKLRSRWRDGLGGKGRT